MFEELLNNGLEVSQGANSRQWRHLNGPHHTTKRGQQESGLDHFKGNDAVKPEASLALVGNAGAQRCFRQVNVEHQHGGNLQGRIGVRIENQRGGSHFFLRRAAVSCSLSHPIAVAFNRGDVGVMEQTIQ